MTCLSTMRTLFVTLLLVAGVSASVAETRGKAVRETKDPVIREAGPAECDRSFPDKTLCPPKTMPESQRCEVLATDIAGLTGRTGYAFEQKKMDMRKQYKLMCAQSRGSEFECEHLGRDLAGSTGTKGYTAEVRKGDLRWIYERRCGESGGAKQVVVPAVIVQ